MHMMKLRFILVAVCVVCFHGEFYDYVFFFFVCKRLITNQPPAEIFRYLSRESEWPSLYSYMCMYIKGWKYKLYMKYTLCPE